MVLSRDEIEQIGKTVADEVIEKLEKAREETRCPVELKPMAEWVVEEDPRGTCRECLLGPVLQWYRDTLQENNKKALANELSALTETATPLQICEKLDIIKTVVEESLRERLKDFDCATQSFDPDEVLEESTTAEKIS